MMFIMAQSMNFLHPNNFVFNIAILLQLPLFLLFLPLLALSLSSTFLPQIIILPIT